MILAGVNIGMTEASKPLRDGGAAIVVDGVLSYALAEERLTREKAAGGYHRSLVEGLRHLGLDEPSHVFSSSCCQPLQSSGSVNFQHVDHHESHAALAYFASGKSEAVVCVADAGGDVLSQADYDGKWWKYSRQQLSIFLGSDGRLELLDRQFDLPGDCGLGEMYRAITYYLGWPSGRHAGKTMALSAYGGDIASDDQLFFDWVDDTLSCKIGDFEPLHPFATARKLLLSINREDLTDAWEKNASEQARAEIARIAQSSLEFAIGKIAKHWCEKLNCEDLCFSGGVALNCTAAKFLEQRHGLSVFIPPGAGDSGQCVGNAIVGYIQETGEPPSLGAFPYLGIHHKTSHREIELVMCRLGLDGRIISHHDQRSLFSHVASSLFNGEVVFWHQGRSEFGARALGNRSILANPMYGSVVQRLNRLKQREHFNPFAASCLYEESTSYFADAKWSPYMTLAFDVRPAAMQREISSVVHKDGSCRAHIFRREDNSRYYDLISAFKERSGLGLVLNTSLNGPGEPIVETIEDTLRLFRSTDVSRTLVIDDFIVEKN